MSGKAEHFYQFGPFRLNRVKRRLLREDEIVPLTPKAFDTLLALVEQSGKTVEKDDLMKQVWPDAIVEENNLNQNISALRRSLGDTRQDCHYIATIPGLGYRFIADVTEVEGGSVEKQSLTPVLYETESSQEAVATEAPVLERERRDKVGSPRLTNLTRILRYGLVVIAAFAVVALGYLLFIREKTPTRTLAVTSIAVLPLENLSGDSSQEYFADGITDALIGDVANIAQLRVISRTSSMHYKGTKKSLPEIASELNVDAVVEGTVQRFGDRVRIRVQLIHAATDRHLWAETYERDMRDVLDLQSEIAEAIAREVQIQTMTGQQPQHPRKPVQPKAFDDYLQGRYLYWNKRSEENLHKAIEYFQSAIKEDPSYAQAYVGLAESYNALGSVQIGLMPPGEARQLGNEAATKALELDGESAEAHCALGYVQHYNWDWKGAEEKFRRAIELRPNYAHAHNYYASYLMSRGRVDESIVSVNRARELDPLSLAISVQRAFLLENARRYDEAIAQLQQVIERDPDHYQAYWFLGHIYALNKQYDEGIAATEKAVSLSGRSPASLGMLGLVYGLSGRQVEATNIKNEMLVLSRRRYVTPAAMAYVFIGLGDYNQAMVWLEKAYQEHSNYLAYLNTNPIVDPLRSDPRFVNLARRIGLPQSDLETSTVRK